MSYEPLPNEDPDLDIRIDHDDDDDNEEEVNTTQPFRPGASSTPYTPGAAYHPGEAHEMTHLPKNRAAEVKPSLKLLNTRILWIKQPCLKGLESNSKPAFQKLICRKSLWESVQEKV